MSKVDKIDPVDWNATDSSNSDESDSENDSNASNEEMKEEHNIEQHYHDTKSQNHYSKYPKDNHRNKKYGNNKMNEMDPNGNLAQFYYRDPDFYVTVIGKEEPPYEFQIKIDQNNHSSAKPLSIHDIKDILAEYCEEEFDVAPNNYYGFSVYFS